MSKKDPQGLAAQANIKHTATFIIYLADKEIGRIIERPQQSLVNDISTMITEFELSAS